MKSCLRSKDLYDIKMDILVKQIIKGTGGGNSPPLDIDNIPYKSINSRFIDEIRKQERDRKTAICFTKKCLSFPSYEEDTYVAALDYLDSLSEADIKILENGANNRLKSKSDIAKFYKIVNKIKNILYGNE